MNSTVPPDTMQVLNPLGVRDFQHRLEQVGVRPLELQCFVQAVLTVSWNSSTVMFVCVAATM